MSSRARKDFDEWFTDHYDDLSHVARRLHPDWCDLLHHTYLGCVLALRKNKNILDNLPGYVHTSMWNLSTGTFRKLYQISDAPSYTHISSYDMQEAILKISGYNFHMISQLESSFETPLSNPLMEVFSFYFIIAFATGNLY